jgi:hypothetical protein
MTIGLALFAAAAPAVAQPEPTALEVPGYHPAVFVPPAGGGPRPVVIGLHGNFDRPEWMCAAWAGVVRGRAFLLCPRGRQRADAPGLDRWELPAAHVLRREIAAARAALVARFGARIDESAPDVYVGFSQGAHRISRLAGRDPESYPRIQLVEGGNTLFRAAGARRYARSRGRVAVVCALPGCERNGRNLARVLERGRAAGRVERIAAAHHELDRMAPAIERTFDWLVADDPRFDPRFDPR